MKLILALSDGQLVGVLEAQLYEGPEKEYPHGWKHLLDQGVTFDQVDAETNEETAHRLLANFAVRKYRVEAVEKFLVRTTYMDVWATCDEEAEQRCRGGMESYHKSSIDEGDEEWIETVSVKEQ